MKNYKLLKLTLAIFLSFLGSALFFSAEALAAPQTFTVVNTNDSGAGSLRQAVLDANGNGNPADQDVIDFNIAGAGTQTIGINTVNYTITQPLLIDGYTQSDAQANTAAWPDPMNGTLRVAIDASGVALLGGSGTFVVQSSNVTIKGIIISNAQEVGVRVYGGNSDVLIQGNYINTDATADVAAHVGGQTHGVVAFQTTDLVIGGQDPEDRNVITAARYPITLQSDIGTVIQGNNLNMGADSATNFSSTEPAVFLYDSTDTIVGGAQTGEGNYIANAPYGISTGSTTENPIIAGNYIQNNQINGVNLETVAVATIGGSTDAARNVITDNGVMGIFIFNDSSDITIKGNYVGVAEDGVTAAPNADNGIRIDGTTNAVVGGVAAEERNIIANNGGHGIRYESSTTGSFTNNLIQANGVDGISLSDTNDATVGSNEIIENTNVGVYTENTNTTVTLDSNTINDNGLSGVHTTGTTTGFVALGNSVDNNLAGFTLFGDSSDFELTNNSITNNSQDGVTVLCDCSAELGILGAGNIITGNAINGIGAHGLSNVIITDNVINTNFSGLNFDDATTGFVESNDIYDNTDIGIIITSTDTVSASENNIYSNGGLGIDLGQDGVTPNDPNDPDPGPNTLLNFPDNLVYKEESGNTELTYTLDVPAGDYRVEFYSNSTPDGSGYGEGETFLESHSAASDGSGPQSFSYTLSGVGHDNISAIATEEDFADAPRGPTSEFSATATEYVPQTDLALTKTLNNPQDYQPNGTVEYTATLTNNGPDAIDLNQLDGSGVNPFATSLFIDVLPPDQSVAAGAMTPFNPTNTNDVECTWYGPGSASLAPFFPAYSDHSLLLCHYSGGTEELLNDGESFDMTFETTLSSDSDLNYINYVFTGAENGLDPAFDQVFTDCVDTAFGSGFAVEDDVLDCMITSQSNNVGFAGAPTNIELTKTLLNPEDVSPGSTISYEVIFTNNGPGDVNLADYSAASSIVAPFFVDIYPANHLTYAGFSSSSGLQCIDVGEGTAAFLGPAASDHLDDGLALCVTPNESEILASGESIATILSFTVDSAVGQSFTNYAYTARTFSDPGSLTLYNAVSGATSDILDSYNASSNFVRTVYTASGTTTNQIGTSTSGSLSSTGQKVLLVALAALLLITAGGLGLLYRHKRKT